MENTTDQLQALPKSCLLFVVSEWENTISWLRTYAGEAQIIHDGCRLWQAKTKAKMKQAMLHYDGCIRQLERCCNDIRKLLSANNLA